MSQTRNYVVVLVCPNGHRFPFEVTGGARGRNQAVDLAKWLDGTHEKHGTLPRADNVICKCLTCEAVLDAEVIEPQEDP